MQYLVIKNNINAHITKYESLSLKILCLKFSGTVEILVNIQAKFSFHSVEQSNKLQMHKFDKSYRDCTP